MGQKVSIKFDGERLKKQIFIRNLTMPEIDEALGVSRGYTNKICARGTISPQMQRLLQSVFNISYEDYKPLPEPELPKVKTEPAQLDYERLYKVIYSAVYEAVKKAWSE